MCEYDKQNLYYSQVFLEHSIDVDLQQYSSTSLRTTDGGPVMWNILQKTLQGAATLKMIKAQKIINEMKLIDVPGLDVGKFHEKVKLMLYACSEQGKLLLDVGSTVIKSHLGTTNIAFNATVMRHAGEQVVIGTSEEQYADLLPQLDSLINIYNSTND